jgi:hypothetical protein
MKEKILSALKKISSNWFSFLTMLAAAACTLINFWLADEKLSGVIISGVLTLIAVEFFGLLVGRMDSLKGDLKEVKNSTSKLSTRSNDLTGQMIAEAKKDLFFCGCSLNMLIPHRGALLDVSDKVHIRLLVMDASDQDVRDCHKTVFGRLPPSKSLDHLEVFAQKKKLEIRTTKYPLTMVVSAKDISSSTGAMQITFQEYGKEAYNTPCVNLAATDVEWYDFYKNQIKVLWEESTAWNPGA